MVRIALVNPQIVTSRWKASFQSTDDIAIRHSLAQLSSVLKAHGHEPVLIDFRLLSGWAQYEEQLRLARPDVLCLTVHTCERAVAIEAGTRAKAILPGVWSIAGGIDPTMFPDLYLQSGAVDLVIQGEGEITLPKILNAAPLKGGAVHGESPDLDALPFEDRRLWPDYGRRIQRGMLNFPGQVPQVDMILQRGCPWQCKFCCGPGEQNLYTKPSGDKRVFSYRARGIDSIMSELDELYAAYQFRSIIFHDDQFIIRDKWVEQFCEGMRRHGYADRGVKFWAAVRADVICRHGEPGGLMEQLRDAGLQMVSIGFESFSDRQLKWMAKGTTRDQNFRAAEIARKLGIHIFANFILGMPDADGQWHVEDDLLTLQAIDQIRPAVASSSFFSPIPGSPFYDYYLKHEWMKTDAPDATGQRFPDFGKLRGVDYKKLDGLMDRYLARYRSKNRMLHQTKVLLKSLGLFEPARNAWRAWQARFGPDRAEPLPVSGKKL